MKNTLSTILFLMLFIGVTAQAAQTCQDYLMNIALQYGTNKTQAQATLAPYLMMSGKYLQDLGFAEACLRMDNAEFTTIQFYIPYDHYNFTIYYGFCFTNICSASDLNVYRTTVLQLLENFTTINVPNNSQLSFIYSPIHREITGSSILMFGIFAILIAIGSVYSIQKWAKMCQQPKQQSQSSHRYTFEDGEVYQEEELTIIKRASIEYKCSEYLFGKKQKSNKIISFSVFKLFCVPMVILGQQFYMRNYAAFNYFSFQNQIYTTFYSKLAMFSVYLPDSLFFISGFLLAHKCLQAESFQFKQSLVLIGRKLRRLYPVYIAVLLIYWLISPSLHAGPVWYVYTDQVQLCNSRWWRSFLLFDNWFKKNCFAGGWFVEVEIQSAVLGLVFLLIYTKSKKIGLMIYLAVVIGLLVAIIVLSPLMPVSIENTLDHRFLDFFKHTYSHFLFYMFGIGIAMVKNHQPLNQKLEQILEKKKGLQIGLTIFSIGLSILILLRPSVWASASGLQFTLSRLGAFLSFLILFWGGIFRSEDSENHTIVHKLAYYTYPMMLLAFIVTSSSVWGMQSLSYISSLTFLNLLIPELLITVIFGAFIGILVEFRAVKK